MDKITHKICCEQWTLTAHEIYYNIPLNMIKPSYTVNHEYPKQKKALISQCSFLFFILHISGMESDHGNRSSIKQ